MKSFEKNYKDTLILTVCGMLTIALLISSALYFVKSDVFAASPKSNNINVQCDSGLYNGLLALSEFDGKTVPDNLYVLINGKAYPVTTDEDGMYVVENVEGITDNGQEIDPIDIPLSPDVTDSSRYTVDANGNKIYHIVWGDTLSELALEFDSSVEELADYNSIPNVDLIYADDYMYLP